jgi:hypothetical protein
MRREEGKKRQGRFLRDRRSRRYSSIPDLMWREEGEKREGGVATLNQDCTVSDESP